MTMVEALAAAARHARQLSAPGLVVVEITVTEEGIAVRSEYIGTHGFAIGRAVASWDEIERDPVAAVRAVSNAEGARCWS